MLSVRHVPETGTSTPDDGLLLPVPGEAKNTILFEERDGSNVHVLSARGVSASLGANRLGAVQKVPISCYVTDARVAIACSKYDKGGGWVGTPGTMLVLNAGSKALAALRRRGKMLVGQIRYPSLSKITVTPKTGWLSKNLICLETRTPQGGTMTLKIEFDKNVDVLSVATDIARRSAAYRLNCQPDLDAHDRQLLGQIAEMTNLQQRADERNGTVVELPAPQPLTEDAARIAPPRTAASSRAAVALAVC